MTATEELLTVAEACTYLKVTRATLYRWARGGRLRLIKLAGRSTRLRRSDIECLLEPGARSIPHVTVVGPEGYEVVDLGPERLTAREAVARHAAGLQTPVVFVNQELCEDLDTPLSAGDLIVVLPPEQLVARGSVDSQDDNDGWLRLAESSFNRDWNNDQDAIYDNWKELYGVSSG
ncbi:MAG TPA: helix-turn-helix domain-containing protein [Dehalococcoidia bacterium]|nr:helix-turn-helix domain-containing protein [Dehalococcoidia bacterium]